MVHVKEAQNRKQLKSKLPESLHIGGRVFVLRDKRADNRGCCQADEQNNGKFDRGKKFPNRVLQFEQSSLLN
jgi:hypothetical protein